MRISLTIFALAAICFGQDVFAQATPKEVVVVDGQLAVNNFPASQTVNGTVSVDNLPAVQDVWVQGATNPVPVVDVTAPVGEEYMSRVISPLGDTTWNINIPTGKWLKLKYMSVRIVGHLNANHQCRLDYGGQIQHYFDLTVNRFPGTVESPIDLSIGTGTAQWNDLPSVQSARVVCGSPRSDGSAVTRADSINLSWFGYLYDSPTP